MKKFISLFVIFALLYPNISGQGLTQNIRGQILDKQSQQPLPGANILIIGTNPIVAAVSDANGNFKFEKMPVGRVSLEARFVGYQNVPLNNLDLTTGKELVVSIEMEEMVTKVDEVVVKGNHSKIKALNEMATISARSFTVEESQRYAGSRNDVARMAQNYAGVSSANDAENSIVIRGNAPGGLLWKLEGVDIPNPNHFGNMGATGGPVGMLNNNVLANSDFITSAFPAEYGNAISGVFDIKMRNGNDYKNEFLGQVGFNGFEFGAEGPVNRENHSSYLINYRYSTLGVLEKMGVNFGTGTAIPYYQDMSFKINMPTLKSGIFELFGLGGISNIDFIRSGKNWNSKGMLYGDENFDIYAKYNSGVLGFNHTFHPDATSYTKFSLAVTGLTNNATLDSISYITHKTSHYLGENLVNKNIYASFMYNKKFNSRNNLRVGLITSRLGFNLVDSAYKASENKFIDYYMFKGNTFLNQVYAQWQYRFTDNLTMAPGVHFQQLTLNNHYSIEPRLGFNWQVVQGQTLSLGYGLHSQAQPEFLLVQAELPNKKYEMPNKNLNFIKSHHFVVGYDINFSNTLRLKTEIYYQYIYNAYVDRDSGFYSNLNAGSMMNSGIPDSVSDKGKGKNYGLEITFEKFLDKGFYTLLTTSLFDSKYRAINGDWRNTAFNTRYVVNLLAGKEFNLGSGKNKLILIDARITASGGQRYTPVDTLQSDRQHQTVYFNNLAFTKQFPNYFRADIRIAFRLNNRRFSQEWAFDVENLTNHDNPLYAEYNQSTQKIDLVNQLGIFPMLYYRINF